MGIGEAVVALGEDPNAYVIKEPAYSMMLTFAGVLGLSGFLLIVCGLIYRLKR
jgi:hypothetical protein